MIEELWCTNCDWENKWNRDHEYPQKIPDQKQQEDSVSKILRVNI